MSNSIRSEISPLRFVITHRPGDEHKFITPLNLKEEIQTESGPTANPNYLLFDDLIYVENAIKEHNALHDILHHFTDGNCYEFIDLLNVIIEEPTIKDKLIDECISLEKELYKNTISRDKLSQLEPRVLIDTLLSGHHNNSKLFTNPIPNLIFTRDIAVCIGNTILITWSSKDVRKRENILAKYIFTYYKPFNDLKVYDYHTHFPNSCIEGGDILVFNNDIICIGISERTPIESIKNIVPLIYKEGFKKIVAIDLPKKRALMHLDTIFTRINTNEVLVFPPILESNYQNHLNKTYVFKNNSIKPELSSKDLIAILNKEGLKIKFIKCGSDSEIMQQREQWTDGANAFALSPGKIIGYDCNIFTLKELKQNGYKVISSSEYIKNYISYNKTEDNFIITIKGSELSRGRGGPRCLTLPLSRI